MKEDEHLLRTVDVYEQIIEIQKLITDERGTLFDETLVAIRVELVKAASKIRDLIIWDKEKTIRELDKQINKGSVTL